MCETVYSLFRWLLIFSVILPLRWNSPRYDSNDWQSEYQLSRNIESHLRQGSLVHGGTERQSGCLVCSMIFIILVLEKILWVVMFNSNLYVSTRNTTMLLKTTKWKCWTTLRCKIFEIWAHSVFRFQKNMVSLKYLNYLFSHYNCCMLQPHASASCCVGHLCFDREMGVYKQR